MFDKNPRTTPGDKYVAGKTAEAIVRAVTAAVAAGGKTLTTEGGAELLIVDVLGALVARYDRKAEAREAKSAA